MASRRSRGSMGVLLLAAEVMSSGINNIPPVTLATMVGQVVLFLRLVSVPWSWNSVCVSSATVWHDRQWRRLFLGPLEHSDDMHLYYNMASFLLKGRYLERRFGSERFAFMLVVFTFLTSATYVGLCEIVGIAFHEVHFIHQCAVGFSGVIFALKVLTTHYHPQTNYNVRGFNISSMAPYWGELILIQIFVPNSSFIGHLAGILVGLAYTRGPLRRIMFP